MSASPSLRRDEAKFQGALEQAPTFPSPRQRTQGVFDGKHLRLAGDDEAVDLSGNDYLALGADPQIKQIMMESLARHDAGVPGSAAFSPQESARALERELARYHFGDPEGTTLTFTANAGTQVSRLEALGLRLQSHFVTDYVPQPAGREVRIPDSGEPIALFIDGDLSFSARHAVRLAHRLAPGRCQIHPYRTGDLRHLAEQLAADCELHGARALRMIASDAVDPATGEPFDMASLCHLAEEYDCLLFVDECHGVGVHGPGGRGVTSELTDFARYRDRLLLMGTLSKAFCQTGGYVTMRAAAVQKLQQVCGPQLLPSTRLAPWIASALADVLALISGDFGEQRRARLRAITQRTGDMLRGAHFELIGTPHSPILAMPLRDASLATSVLEDLQGSGFLVSIFQGPTMPEGGEVIRLAMRADLEPADLDRLVAALVRCRVRHRPAFGLATPMRLPPHRR